MERKDIYLALTAKIPKMVIHTDWYLEFHNWNENNLVSITIRSDWDIDVMIFLDRVSFEEWEDCIWGWVIDMSDYEKYEAMNSEKFSNEEFANYIKWKVDFAFELCFTY